MKLESKSFTVSPPIQGNYETFPSVDETSEETLMKPVSVKVLAARVLARNQQGNFNETFAKQQGNFPPKKTSKSKSFTVSLPRGGNYETSPFAGENTRSTLPEWCRSDCDHFHQLEVPDLGKVSWCCCEVDEKHWRRIRIDTMAECPAAKHPGQLTIIINKI